MGSLGSNGSPTGDVLNGAREPPPLQQTVDPVLLKQQNQNLSKLLSSNGSSTPITNKTASPQSHSQTPMAGNARQNSTAAPGLNVDLNSLSNSPLTNSLSSPPHNVSIAKGMHMGNDLLGSPPCGGVGASSSMSSVGSMAPQGNAVNTKAAASQCLSSAAVNQMMNGPHLAMGAQSRSIAQSMQNVGSSFSQANMMGNAVANTLASAVGNMPFNSQQQGMGQPNMTSNQQQVIKVSFFNFVDLPKCECTRRSYMSLLRFAYLVQDVAAQMFFVKTMFFYSYSTNHCHRSENILMSSHL